METKIISIYTKKEDIKKITTNFKEKSFDSLKKHPHLEFSIMEKATDIELIKQTYSKFDTIKHIELRENAKGQKYYSINYELEDKTYIVIGISNDFNLVINAFHGKTNYKRFIKRLRKNYKNRFI